MSSDDITLGGIRTAAGADLEPFPSSPIATLIASRDAAVERQHQLEMEIFRLGALFHDLLQRPGYPGTGQDVAWRPFEASLEACTAAAIYEIGNQ